jgi:uncharacterized protein YqhQ
MSNQPAVRGKDGVLRPYIGGQALIEGVMMRSPHALSAVVRRRDGSLVVRERPMADLRVGAKALPLVRGVVTLVESLKLGSAALRFATEVYEQDLAEQEREEAEAKARGESTTAPRAAPKPPSALAALTLPVLALLSNEPGEASRAPEGEGGGKKLFTFLSILFAVGLFVMLPQAFAAGTNAALGLGLDVRSAAFQALTGLGKITIVVGYMLLIRRIPEIYRVFQYHGAEHKAIHAYESGDGLSAEAARAKTTLHPRCGTTFLVMVALVSMIVFSAVGPLLPKFGGSALVDNVALFAIKLPFLPVIAAITFELQRVLARFGTSGPLSALLWPGFMVQKITTIEPDDRQLEVAVAALGVALAREQPGAEPLHDAPEDRRYDSFERLPLPA